ncbi:SDR family NAD(P)-dependent oxidoreductase [Salinisphaera sp. P385]|uniref:SDR family NAD(P)-dependent oxidoreductase n=1 Tax=Spectribacter acetivorans TaxID=3075603 RepID=A0ABU3B7H9_9GAMM|nr:SDR family NAD(P)-dependent oxidoreductase [Salinisphaera sp. P385]MDT0617263.1 SDR family NAD(P)-dependent oxidoreductase [Salinisphaera sp. P385]
MPEPALQDRVILITGATGGFGAALAEAAAAAGAQLVLAGRQQKKLEALSDRITAAGGPVPCLFPVDFTRASGDPYQLLAEGIEADLGRLDGVVHAAARFQALTPLAGLELEEWQRALHLGVTVPFALTRACLPLLGRSPDASVVFMDDAVGRGDNAFWGGYAVAKAGLSSLMTLFATEHGHRDDLRFNALRPGPMATPLRARAFPSQDEKAQPTDQAVSACLHLLGPSGRGINGQTLDPDQSDLGGC